MIVGFNQLYNSDLVSIFSYDSDSVYKSSSVKKSVYNLGSSRRILVGKFNNTTASSLIKLAFYLPDSMKKYIESNQVNIISANLKLYPVYKLGDTNITNFRASIYEILSGWNSDGFTSDSLNSGKFQYNPDILETGLTNTDSVVNFSLKTNKVLSWLYNVNDSTRPQPQGLYIQSNNSSSENQIIGFRALPLSSNLRVTELAVIYQYPGKTDTVIYTTGGDVHVLKSEFNSNKTDVVFLQGGVELRSQFYFDLSAIRKEYSINSAVIILNANNNESKLGSNNLDTLIVFRVTDSTLQYFDSSKFSYIIKNSEGRYEGNVITLIQEILNSKNNQGLIVMIKDNLSSAEILAINNQNAKDAILRPKLKIIYAAKNK